MKDIIHLKMDNNLYSQIKGHYYVSLLLRSYLGYSDVFNEDSFYGGLSTNFYIVNINRYVEDKRKLRMGNFLEDEYRNVFLNLINEYGIEELDLKYPHFVLQNKQMYMKYMLSKY